MNGSLVKLKDKSKRLQGFSLVELLIAIVILGILVGIVLVAGSSSQEKARNTAAVTCLDDYQSAFTSAVMYRPGMMNDRFEVWNAAPSSFSSKQGFENLVREMNRSLETKLQLVWDDTLHCYVSQGEDPWGGKFVLLEYPTNDGSESNVWYNPTVTGTEVKSALCCSIWASGQDAGIVPDGNITEISVGRGFVYKSGRVLTSMHGIHDTFDFESHKIVVK